MVPEALQLLFHSTPAGSHFWGGNSSWFPLSSCKVRSCCLTQKQVFHSFRCFEEEARKECAGFQNGAVAVVRII